MSESPGPGRPSLYTPELAALICERLAAGETLRAICRDEIMPSPQTVLGWKRADRQFSEQYDAARRAGYELMADELLDIADDGTNDYVERERENGTKHVVFDAEHVQRSRLRCDNRKWLLSKALPKIYGDKIQHTGGGEGDNPIAVSIIELVAVKPNAPPD